MALRSRRFAMLALLPLLWLMWAPLACAAESLEERVTALEAKGLAASPGGEGFWLLTAELRHLAAGRFWGERAAAVSRSARSEWADPLPAVIDFHAQLEAAGIPLLLVPVPAKTAVLTGALPDGVDAEGLGSADREFLDLLAAKGVRVIDLGPDLASGSRALPYCRSDSHWSGAGAEVAAARIAAALRALPGLEAAAKGSFDSAIRETPIRGDLSRLPGGEAIPGETLPLRFVGTPAPGAGPATGGLEPVAPDPASPVLLLADSHGLVFHAGGDMLARGAGLPDQLALELGFAVDLVAVRGAASNAARLSLLRRGPKALASKRAVVWIFSVREWTQSSQGWRVVPMGLGAPEAPAR